MIEIAPPQENVNYLRIALALQGIAVNNAMCDRIIQTLNAIKTKGGDLTLKDVAELEVSLDQKYSSNEDKG